MVLLLVCHHRACPGDPGCRRRALRLDARHKAGHDTMNVCLPSIALPRRGSIEPERIKRRGCAGRKTSILNFVQDALRPALRRYSASAGRTVMTTPDGSYAPELSRQKAPDRECDLTYNLRAFARGRSATGQPEGSSVTLLLRPARRDPDHKETAGLTPLHVRTAKHHRAVLRPVDICPLTLGNIEEFTVIGVAQHLPQPHN